MLAISSPSDADINIEQVLQTIGYHADCQPPLRTMSLINDYLENVHNLIEPSYSYVIREVEWVQGSITFISEEIIFKSQVIARLLERCVKVAVFAITIGNHLEEMVSQLAQDGLILQATVLDAIGSSAVEKVTDSIQDSISEMARAQGLVTSRRFSPGYCDWNIGQQRMLFWALRDDTAGIRLTRRCLMIPQKSVSGIIGIGPQDVEDYNPCQKCGKQDCPGRR